MSDEDRILDSAAATYRARTWGWHGNAESFLSCPFEIWAASLDSHHRSLLACGASESQRQAWVQEYEVIHAALQRCVVATRGTARGWGIVFEYELPLEGGRRPDVVILAGDTVAVLEFKTGAGATPTVDAVDQAAAYGRDLAEYHEASHDRRVEPVLVIRDYRGHRHQVSGVTITSQEDLPEYLLHFAGERSLDLEQWVSADYAPLPTLVEAARRLWKQEPLPHVRRALSARIPETVDLVAALVERAREEGTRTIVFLTGVPGAGKTLVGLRVVYERADTKAPAVFLSGNGPLVKVLQDALHSRVFVKDLHAYIRTYGIDGRNPKENALVFDEAQRAWDRAQVSAARPGASKSEPELLIDIGERMGGWATLVCLVGEGQSIHCGEEGGLQEWESALAENPRGTRWKVHCGTRVRAHFEALGPQTNDLLDLDTALRSRRAEYFHDWVRHLLLGSIVLAKTLSRRCFDASFPVYTTRDLDLARRYVRRRYEGECDKRYGLLASSHAKNLVEFGIDNGFLATSRTNVAKWFNAPPEDPQSSCMLSKPATEFMCQGLELDLPIVCWGEDLTWEDGKWSYRAVRRRRPLRDPEEVLRNVYRVLLTRGRDGVVLWMPPSKSLDATELALLAAGTEPLPEDLVVDVETAVG